MYQALESKDEAGTGDPSDLAEYAPVLSSTQWHWDPYRGRLHERVNGSPDRVATAGDAWNDEDIEQNDNGQLQYTLDPANVQRIAPLASQGEMLNFAYNTRATDAEGKQLNWLALAPGDGREYFTTSYFASSTWKGRHSDAQTEVFLPPSVAPDTTAVITDPSVHRGLTSGGNVRFAPNKGGGGRLLFATDPKDTAPKRVTSRSSCRMRRGLWPTRCHDTGTAAGEVGGNPAEPPEHRGKAREPRASVPLGPLAFSRRAVGELSAVRRGLSSSFLVERRKSPASSPVARDGRQRFVRG